MKQIQQITSDPKQRQTLTLDDGSYFVLTIAFYPQQFGWFIESLVYTTSKRSVTLSGIRITNNANILHQYRNKIPFGLACKSDENREPMFQQDFSSGASKLYLLEPSDIADILTYLNG